MNSPADLHLKFNIRPSPVLAEHRPLYKIGQLLLILWLSSRGRKSSFPRLHLFNWALKNNSRFARLKNAADANSLKIAAWGFDPALAIAIRFAEAEGLISVAGKGISLTEAGEAFAKDIMQDDDVLVREKGMLRSISRGVTEGMVEDAAKEWQP
ncbi:hypothetical protein [Lysobacter capsici]|uniref:hypothetical protein n=1 Tax=Lysobacter capsici TaxID=435897 RepID=UPI00287B9657|nr:hypothetical protein [Lysobacter capsici]WND81306.1 hypothetical protein RJ610_02705 [Lysobacter capsici]WND86502.1 hypothetical protein RJ609_02705 [Lysobacter capsici]